VTIPPRPADSNPQARPCTANRDLQPVCNRPATVHLVTMCVHEHLAETDRCDDCAAKLRAKDCGCHVCWNGTERHLCRPAVIAESPLPQDAR
jgi:hypothetical protein